MRGKRGQTRVIAIGSHHGDDQAAWACAARLHDPLDSVAEVTLVAEPIRMLDYLDDCRRLLILDACRGGNPVGSVCRLEWPGTGIERIGPASSHSLGLADVLRLAELLDRLPERVIVFGLEVEATEPGGEISPAVSAALPLLQRCVLEELNLADRSESLG